MKALLSFLGFRSRDLGQAKSLNLESILPMLAESARAIRERDWKALNNVFAPNARFSIWESGEGSRLVPWSRTSYLNALIDDKTRYVACSIDISSVRLSSDHKWDTVCTTSSVGENGHSTQTHQRVEIELVRGAPLVTRIEFNLIEPTRRGPDEGAI
jgi:hypothetical protein